MDGICQLNGSTVEKSRQNLFRPYLVENETRGRLHFLPGNILCLQSEVDQFVYFEWNHL